VSDAPASFTALRGMTCAQLAQLGCRRWDDSGLMLFPASWFDSIPPGFEIITILGLTLPFKRTMSRDRRYGMLAFGIIGREARRSYHDEA
jgi:hypothetical protein